MIDRYFDAVDLNNTEIYIEWETPKSKATGTITKAVSEPYLKVIDDENYYGKLIFGWALSEAITKDSGTLKFAVRFIQRDNQNKIVYSFNTLTSQVTIHPNLGTDMTTAIENADNCNARLLERIQESEVVGGAKAKVPYFLLDLVVLEDGYDIEDNHKTGTYTLSAVATADDTGAVSYIWKRGELNPDNSEEGTWTEIKEGASLKMVPLTEEELAAFEYKLPSTRVYHIGTVDDNTTQLDRGLYDLKTNFTDKGQPIPTIYEQRACLEVTRFGLYKAEARNRIFNSLTTADSNIVTFRRPDPVKMVDNQIPDKHIIGTPSAVLAPEVIPAVGDMTYKWYKAPEGKTLNSIVEITSWPVGSRITYGEDYIRICASNDQLSYKLQNVGEGGNANTYYGDIRFYYPEGAVKVKHASWNTNSSAPDMSGEEMCLIAEEHPGVDENGRKFILDWLPFAYYVAENNLWVAYGWNKPLGEYAKLFNRLQWFDENNNLLRDDYIEFQYATDETFNAFGNFEFIPDEVAENIEAKEPGIYKLIATRFRNRAFIDGESIEYRVTNAPVVPDPTVDMWVGVKQISLNDLVNDENATLTFTWDAVAEADGFEVDWFLSREIDGKEDVKIVTQIINSGDIVEASFNPADSAWVSIFEEAGENVEGGLFYAIVRTKLNGEYSGYSTKPKTETMFQIVG